tara:strand:- start:3350 stop:4675 length:1326 start_codon:yes stop_codon:yes gene_type:complete
MRQVNSIRNPEVYNKFLDVGAAFNKGLMMATRGGTISTNNPVGAVKNNYESKIENYLNNLPQGADLTKVPDAYRNDVQKFLMGQKQNYVKLSRELSQYEVGSNRYIDLQGQMNNISNSFKNLNSQLANYSEKKVELMNNIKKKTTSLYGENQANVNLLSNIFSEEYPISIDEFGRISFIGDDKVLKYEDIPSYNTKEYKLSEAITDMSVKAYTSGKKMLKGGIMYTKYKNDITSAIDQGGKASLMSLIHDGLVGKTKMISDPYIAENVKAYESGAINFEALRDVVVDNYMDVVVRNSNTGYKARQVAASRTQPRTGDIGSGYYRGEFRGDFLVSEKKDGTVLRRENIKTGEISYIDRTTGRIIEQGGNKLSMDEATITIPEGKQYEGLDPKTVIDVGNAMTLDEATEEMSGVKKVKKTMAQIRKENPNLSSTKVYEIYINQ